MRISFTPEHDCVFDRDAVAFRATVDGNNLLCLVSLEALKDNLGNAPHEEPFVRHRLVIEGAARRLIQAGQVANGEVLIGSQQLRYAMSDDAT